MKEPTLQELIAYLRTVEQEGLADSLTHAIIGEDSASRERTRVKLKATIERAHVRQETFLNAAGMLALEAKMMIQDFVWTRMDPKDKVLDLMAQLTAMIETEGIRLILDRPPWLDPLCAHCGMEIKEGDTAIEVGEVTGPGAPPPEERIIIHASCDAEYRMEHRE